MKRLLVALALALAAAPASARADFAAAAQAYDGGDYETAFREWRRLAEEGDVAAQLAVADMYRNGAGRAVDLARAAAWYRRAAARGDAVAQMNLGEMYASGLGLARDAVEAYVWLSLAAAQGRDWARTLRGTLARAMTPAEIAAARRRLRRRAPGTGKRP